MKKLTIIILLLILSQFNFAQKITSTTVYFASGKSTLTTSSKEQIDALVGTLPEGVDLQVEIYSFTDNIEANNVNLELSQYRSDNVLNYLIERGIRIKLSHIFDGGASNQVVPNQSALERAKNRRSVIIFSALVPTNQDFVMYERQIGVLPRPKDWVDPYTINGRLYFADEEKPTKKKKQAVVKPQ